MKIDFLGDTGTALCDPDSGLQLARAMKDAPTTSDVYDGQEFDEWSEFDGLIREEETLLRRHLLGRPKAGRILEVGTGAGRLLIELHGRGFTSLRGIDLSERLLAVAREKAAQSGAGIGFEIQDAADLRFADGSFDVVLGRQQVLSFIESPEARRRALQHFHRVLAPGGLLLASVLHWESRRMNPWLGIALAPLKLLKGDGRHINRQYLPWLKLGGKANLRYPFEAQPYTYWYRKAEFEQAITGAGFELLDVTTSRTLLEGGDKLAFGGMLYAVARKPEGVK